MYIVPLWSCMHVYWGLLAPWGHKVLCFYDRPQLAPLLSAASFLTRTLKKADNPLLKQQLQLLPHLLPLKVRLCTTRFAPNRVATDMEGNGESEVWVIYEDFWGIFLGILEKLVHCSKKRTSINVRPTKKTKF